jgi:hypothetical protein
MLEQTRVHLESNQALLAASRVLIARSRRRLNPFFGVSGGAAPTLRETARVLIASGVLPPTNGSIYGGYGTGKRCVICQQLVPPTEVELEVPGPINGAVYCHLPCFNVWKEESVPATNGSSADEPDDRPSATE